MSDLVKRIRDYPGERIAGSYELREQAADRIEALEKALREILDWDELPLRIQWIARNALG